MLAPVAFTPFTVSNSLSWLSVTFTTVMVYETSKILLSLNRVCGMEWCTALYGGDVRAWARRQLRPVQHQQSG